jgi:hypothetical protein
MIPEELAFSQSALSEFSIRMQKQKRHVRIRPPVDNAELKGLLRRC